MLNAVSSFFANNWYWLLIFAGMSVLVFLLLRLQVMLREHMAKNIQILLVRDPGLCLERLENNRRLKWLFRKPILLLWKLDCYLALGQDRKALQTIDLLRSDGCSVPVVVGGAVLTPEYAREIGADYYAKDAKQTADIAKEILG